MVYFLLALIVFFALLPMALAFHRKVQHKKLLVLSFLLTSLQPLATIVVPMLATPELFEGAMQNYAILIMMYYFIIFIFYWFVIQFIPSNIENNFNQLSKRSSFAPLIFLVGIGFFSILVIHSNGIFLTNPRLGYQSYREGLGFVWVFYILSVSVLFYFLAIKREINIKKVLLFVGLMFMTGSKALILQVFIKSFLIYIWLGKKIKKWHILLGSLILVLLMLKLFDQFGASESFLVRAVRYFDFMKMASLVFEDYANGTLEHTYGSIFTSSFWSYVPRALYPDKPYAYGSVSLLEMYYPGMAATGHTPSFGILTHDFVDFWWFAPIFAVVLNLSLIIQVLSLAIVVTNANVSNRFRVGALLFVFAPGFGFHLPIIMTVFVAFILVPALFERKIINVNEEKNDK